MKRKSGVLSGWNLVLLILCMIQTVVLAGFLIWDYQTEEKEKEVRKESIIREQELNTLGQGLEILGENRETSQALGDQGELTGQERIGGETGPEEAAGEENGTEPAAKGISCWGDEFFRGEETEQYSYRVALQKELDENGYDLEVEGKTLSGASTLSLMKMAGIPEEEIAAYITAHEAAAGGMDLPVTETGIRDLTEEQMARTETDYIPVIFMGYYGGWNHDTQELIEQQTKILETFVKNRERFLVVGARPLDGSVTRADFDEAMKEAWGEHYISAAEATSQNVGSRGGQEELGKAIFEKLVEMEYIKKEEL